MKLYTRCERCRNEASPAEERHGIDYRYVRFNPPVGWDFISGTLLCGSCLVVVKESIKKAIGR